MSYTTTRDRTIYTTGQVARICKVAPRTVSKWFDSGRLKGFRIPGSEDRRIPRGELVRFMREYGMPLSLLDNNDPGVLAVGLSDAAVLRLSEIDGVRVERAADGFEAGLVVRESGFRVVVISLSDGVAAACRLVAGVLGVVREPVPVIAVGEVELADESERLTAVGVLAVVPAADLDTLVAKVSRAVNPKPTGRGAK